MPSSVLAVVVVVVAIVAATHAVIEFRDIPNEEAAGACSWVVLLERSWFRGDKSSIVHTQIAGEGEEGGREEMGEAMGM